MTYKIDPARERLMPRTGIQIRAIDPLRERWVAADMAHLDRASLLKWLQTKSQEQTQDVIGIMLGHGHLSEPSTYGGQR